MMWNVGVAVTPGLLCPAFAKDLCILSARITSKLGLGMNITPEHPTIFRSSLLVIYSSHGLFI